MNDSAVHVEAVIPANWTLVPPEASIVVRFSEGVDARSAQDGIMVPGENIRGVVRLNDAATEATWTPLVPVPDGEYRLWIDGVTSRDGARPVARYESHFVVSARENAALPYGQIVLHRSTTKLRNATEQYAISKLLDPQSGRRYVVAIDDRGERVDLEAAVAEDHRITFDKYGKIHPALFEELERRSDSDRIPVGVWVAVREQFVDKAEFDIDPCGCPPDQLLGYRERLRRALVAAARLIREHAEGASPRLLQAAPVILTELTPPQIRRLSTTNDVAALFLYEPEGILDVGDSMKISGAESVVNADGWNAAGVRVAVWEGAPDNTSQLAIQAQYTTTPPESTEHARLVTGIIRNTQFSGVATLSGRLLARCYAPRARVYSANSKDTGALDWAVGDRECRVVNQSFHRRSEAVGGDRSMDDFTKDYMVVHYPFPTIVHAAGNFRKGDEDGIASLADEYVNHKGFNSVSVGNHDDTASAMSGSSVYRNPPSPHGDRELPEICANGIQVSAVGLTNGGTSFASPAVAGSVALLQQIDPALASWPEGTRAILSASAVNVTGRTWARELRAGVDASDGAGALDIREAARIAKQRVSAESPGQQRGWNVGTLRPNDFDANTGWWRFGYRIRIPMIGASTRVKVALAWDMMGTETVAPFITVWLASVPNDYDLHVYDDKGALVSWSASWDNSYEIVEFTGTPGKTYTARIVRGDGEEQAYYGIAWSIRDLDFASAIAAGDLNLALAEP